MIRHAMSSRTTAATSQIATNVGRSALRRAARAVDGILLLDKPLGLSSNAALQRARRAYGAAKAGHGGSLDPLATGMLPVCFGQATKTCGSLLGASKTYRATIKLGTATQTADAEGETIATAPVPELMPALVDEVLASFVGVRTQIPPMHSALKVAGRPLYERARRGEVVDRAPRRIEIHSIARIAMGGELLEVELRCSKGTYVRTLAEDLATALGTVGHLAALRRLAVEPFGAARMIALDEVESLAERDPQRLADCLLPIDAALCDLEAIELGPDQAAALVHGQALQVEHAPAGLVRAYDRSGRFLGLTDVSASGVVRVRRLFVPGVG